MRIRVLLSMLLVQACATSHNPYALHYEPEPEAPKPEPAAQRAVVMIVGAHRFESQTESMLRGGWVALGSSGFNAPVKTVTTEQLREQAREVHAQAVLLGYALTNTENGPVGADSTYRPPPGPLDTVTRADYTAMFFVQRPLPVGLYFDTVDDTTRSRLNVAFAEAIRLVVAGSPADKAGLKRGDIVLRIDGAPVTRYFEYDEFIDQRRGRRMEFLIDRAGREMRKIVDVMP